MFAIRHRLALFAAACALVSTLGCASSQQQKGDTSAVLYNKDKMVCERDFPTGSHIPRTRCYRRQQADQRRASDQANVDAMKLGGAIDPTPGESSTGRQ
jgi:hypothetical protein